MAITNSISIDQVAGTGLLIIYQDSVEVMRYTYSGTDMTFAARVSDTVITLDELIVNVKSFLKFRSLILNELAHSWVKQQYFVRVEVNATLKEKIKMDVNGFVLVDATNTANVITFQSRAAATYPYYIFHKYCDLREQFIEEITRTF